MISLMVWWGVFRFVLLIPLVALPIRAAEPITFSLIQNQPLTPQQKPTFTLTSNGLGIACQIFAQDPVTHNTESTYSAVVNGGNIETSPISIPPGSISMAVYFAVDCNGEAVSPSGITVQVFKDISLCSAAASFSVFNQSTLAQCLDAVDGERASLIENMSDNSGNTVCIKSADSGQASNPNTPGGAAKDPRCFMRFFDGSWWVSFKPRSPETIEVAQTLSGCEYEPEEGAGARIIKPRYGRFWDIHRGDDGKWEAVSGEKNGCTGCHTPHPDDNSFMSPIGIRRSLVLTREELRALEAEFCSDTASSPCRILKHVKPRAQEDFAEGEDSVDIATSLVAPAPKPKVISVKAECQANAGGLNLQYELKNAASCKAVAIVDDKERDISPGGEISSPGDRGNKIISALDLRSHFPDYKIKLKLRCRGSNVNGCEKSATSEPFTADCGDAWKPKVKEIQVPPLQKAAAKEAPIPFKIIAENASSCTISGNGMSKNTVPSFDDSFMSQISPLVNEIRLTAICINSMTNDQSAALTKTVSLPETSIQTSLETSPQRNVFPGETVTFQGTLTASLPYRHLDISSNFVKLILNGMELQPVSWVGSGGSVEYFRFNFMYVVKEDEEGLMSGKLSVSLPGYPSPLSSEPGSGSFVVEQPAPYLSLDEAPMLLPDGSALYYVTIRYSNQFPPGYQPMFPRSSSYTVNGMGPYTLILNRNSGGQSFSGYVTIADPSRVNTLTVRHNLKAMSVKLLALVRPSPTLSPSPAPTLKPIRPTPTTTPTPTPTPSPPPPLRLQLRSSSSSAVTFDIVNIKGTESGFRLEKKVANGTFAQIADVKVPELTASGLVANTTYSFRMRSYTGTITSEYTDVITLTTLAAPARFAASTEGCRIGCQTASCDQTCVNFSWISGSTAQTAFKVEKFTGGFWLATYYLTPAPGTSSYQMPYQSAEQRIRLKAVNQDTKVESNPSSEISLLVLEAPENLIASRGTSKTQAVLSWRSRSVGLDGGFKIERKAVSGAYTQIAVVAAGVTSYTDSSAKTPNTYYYRVRAYRGTTHSPFSAETFFLVPK